MPSRARLRKRLRSLAFVEGVNVVLLPAAVLTAVGSRGPLTTGVVAGAAAVSVALAAGSLFWFRRLRGRVSLRWCRVCEAGLAVAALLAAVATGLSALDLRTGALLVPIIGFGLALFAACEIVNYRFVQISAGGWLAWGGGRVRRPHLAIELRRARRKGSGGTGAAETG
ncbi:hypothetical protein [Pseudonocardia sp.]|uniref:hypothetical protein n=1 Tax=Pseudonocardia sp. TaxID=60912 RepID=UPI00260A9320|nr:hypothetical protein [Pseudonocardia sp.]